MHHETAADGSTSIRVETPDGAKTYPTTELFRRQLADKLKIPDNAGPATSMGTPGAGSGSGSAAKSSPPPKH